MLYYALSDYATRMPVGDAYWNFAIGGLVELPSIISTIWLYERYSRRWPLCWAVLGTAASLLLLAVADAYADLESFGLAVVAVGTFGKFCTVNAYNMLGILQ